MNDLLKPVVYDHTDIKIREHAIYASIVVKDANGKLWKFEGGTLYFDMRPYEPQQDYVQAIQPKGEVNS